jgi:hypothetical protein
MQVEKLTAERMGNELKINFNLLRELPTFEIHGITKAQASSTSQMFEEKKSEQKKSDTQEEMKKVIK